MNSFAEFLDMGGYARYVWWSYGLAAVVLIANVLAPWQRARSTRRRLARRHKLEQNRIEGRQQ